MWSCSTAGLEMLNVSFMHRIFLTYEQWQNNFLHCWQRVNWVIKKEQTCTLITLCRKQKQEKPFLSFYSEKIDIFPSNLRHCWILHYNFCRRITSACMHILRSCMLYCFACTYHMNYTESFKAMFDFVNIDKKFHCAE